MAELEYESDSTFSPLERRTGVKLLRLHLQEAYLA